MIRMWILYAEPTIACSEYVCCLPRGSRNTRRSPYCCIVGSVSGWHFGNFGDNISGWRRHALEASSSVSNLLTTAGTLVDGSLPTWRSTSSPKLRCGKDSDRLAVSADGLCCRSPWLLWNRISDTPSTWPGSDKFNTLTSSSRSSMSSSHHTCRSGIQVLAHRSSDGRLTAIPSNKNAAPSPRASNRRSESAASRRRNSERKKRFLRASLASSGNPIFVAILLSRSFRSRSAVVHQCVTVCPGASSAPQKPSSSIESNVPVRPFMTDATASTNPSIRLPPSRRVAAQTRTDSSLKTNHIYTESGAAGWAIRRERLRSCWSKNPSGQVSSRPVRLTTGVVTLTSSPSRSK